MSILLAVRSRWHRPARASHVCSALELDAPAPEGVDTEPVSRHVR
jgi:hypothetical protein